jgi:hypothetical protein
MDARPRRRFRPRLWWLMALDLVCALGFGWWAQVERERRAVEAERRAAEEASRLGKIYWEKAQLEALIILAGVDAVRSDQIDLDVAQRRIAALRGEIAALEGKFKALEVRPKS